MQYHIINLFPIVFIISMPWLLHNTFTSFHIIKSIHNILQIFSNTNLFFYIHPLSLNLYCPIPCRIFYILISLSIPPSVGICHFSCPPFYILLYKSLYKKAKTEKPQAMHISLCKTCGYFYKKVLDK